jgi:ABC-type transport system involved in multi-copper enzyme maturation permease subunit
MTSLLWKDYRLSRPILLMGVILFLAPYATVAGTALYSFGLSLPPMKLWPEALLPACLVSLGLSLVTLVTLAGSSIATERADRSAEFLAYLPPSRRRVLASKLLVVLVPVLCVWAVNVPFAFSMVPASGHAPGGVGDVRASVLSLSSAAVMLFGAALLGSAMLDSAAIATSLGFGATVAVIFVLNMLRVLRDWTPQELAFRANVTFVVLGGTCFICAAVHYLRRVEP